MVQGSQCGVSIAIGLAMGLTAVSGGALAQAKTPIEARRAAMKEMAGRIKGVGGFLNGGGHSVTAQTVARYGEAMAAVAERIPTLFPKGTSLDDGVGETGAKPDIWRRWPEFRKAAAHLRDLAMELSTAARTGDKQAIKYALGTLGRQGCGGCHRAFRRKQEK